MIYLLLFNTGLDNILEKLSQKIPRKLFPIHGDIVNYFLFENWRIIFTKNKVDLKKITWEQKEDGHKWSFQIKNNIKTEYKWLEEGILIWREWRFKT